MGTRSNRFTRWMRWLATFVGFPAAGVVARLFVGDVDDLAAAAVGGLMGGAVLGAVQAFVGGIEPRRRVRWIVATACGLSAGLAAGAHLVDYGTDTTSLVVMGAVCGALVGLAQAFSLPVPAAERIAWMIATPALWAVGWFVTSHVIVDVERHHATFGSSGALLVSALSGILVVARRSDDRLASPVVASSSVAGVS